jgi:hypothetical protein
LVSSEIDMHPLFNTRLFVRSPFLLYCLNLLTAKNLKDFVRLSARGLLEEELHGTV